MMAVFFDIDDTLLDHEAAARAGAAALHRSLAAAAPVEQFVAAWAAALDRNFPRYLAGELTFQGQRRERIREVVDGGLTDEAADSVFAGYQQAYEAAWTLFPDVLPCLDALSHGRVGIISNGKANAGRLVGDYNNPILKPEAADVVKKHGEISLAGIGYPTPRNQCWPGGVPFVFTTTGIQVLQQPGEIIGARPA